MNKKQISSLVENFLNQARVTGLTLAHIGFSYTTLHNKKFAVSSHLEVLPSIGFGIPYYGSLTLGIAGEITVSNLPTSVKKVTLNKDLLNKMETLAEYGTFADDKFKVDDVKDKPINDYFKDFSKAFISTTELIAENDITGVHKSEVEGSVQLSDKTANSGLLIVTHVDNVPLLDNALLSATSLNLSTISAIPAGSFGMVSHYSETKMPNYVTNTSAQRMGPDGLTITAFEIITTPYTKPAHSAKITILKDRVAVLTAGDKFKTSFNNADLQDEAKVDKLIKDLAALEAAQQAYHDHYDDDAMTRNDKLDEFGKACNKYENDNGLTRRNSALSETITELENALQGAATHQLRALDSTSLRNKFHKTIADNITEFYQNGSNSSTKVNINSVEFNTSDKINTFLNNIASFNIRMANTITANVAVPFANGATGNFDLGAQTNAISTPYFALSQVDTRRFSSLVYLYKGFNVNLHINKGIGDIIKGVSISAHISLSDYIKDTWKAKMYYNFFNTQKKERKTDKLDYNTAKEIAASIKDSKFSTQFKKVANDDSSSANPSLKPLDDRDWVDVSGIDKDYESVLNVHSAGNKIGVTVYPYILNGDGINVTFIIPALNISKLKDFWFLKLSYVKVLSGNPLCDDGVSIQSSYELDSESELTVA